MNMLRTLVAGVALLGATSLAFGSDIRLHLPVPVKWGKTMLEPGDYVFSCGANGPFASIKGQGKQASVIVNNIRDEDRGPRGLLRLVDINGVQTVASFQSGSTGKRYEFAMPRVKKNAPQVVIEAVTGE